MQNSPTSQVRGLWLVTGAAILWGTIGVATQAIFKGDTTTSLFINLGRMLVASPVLLLACKRTIGRAMFDIPVRDLWIMLLMGTLLAASQAAYFAAIQASGVTLATLLTICTAPLVVTGLAVLLRLETLTRRVVFALVFALVGSALLVGFHAPEGESQNVLLGALLAVFGAVTYAGALVCGRLLARAYHPLQVTSITFSVGALVLIIVNLLVGFTSVHTSQGWLLVLYLGLVPTALAYWLFQKGLRTVSATVASIVGMLDPLVAAVLAWLLFGETLTLVGLIGAVLLILSIVLLSLNNQPAA